MNSTYNLSDKISIEKYDFIEKKKKFSVQVRGMKKLLLIQICLLRLNRLLVV